jgi:membrane associated rhomboid family serine protease
MSESEKHYDAASRLLTKAKESESWDELSSAYFEFMKSLFYQLKTQQARITLILVSLTTLVFLLQSILYLYLTDSFLIGTLVILIQPGALQGLTNHLFLDFPWVAWPLSEFLHKGMRHFIGNVVLLTLFGKVLEPKFKTKHYILWFVSVALIVKPIDAYITLSTSTKSNVAVYGISDFVYSLGFFTVLDLATGEHRNELEYLALLIGVLAILQVGYHGVNAGMRATVEPINFAHLVGGILGLVVFGLVRYQE